MHTDQANTILGQFNETIDKWLIYLDNYSFEALLKKPAPKSWSIGQMYVHLALSTGYFIEQMKEALTDEENKDQEKHRHAAGMFARNAFPDAVIEGPDTDDNIPQPASREQLINDLTTIKQKANALFGTHDIAASAGKSKHPGLHYFTALEWLQFSEMHMRHHFRQKSRIDSQLATSTPNY